MKDKTRFTKKEIMVVVACSVFLLLNIGAIGSGGRRQAKDLACLSNLFKWGTIFQMYTNNNDGYFFSGAAGTPGHWWMADLEERYQSYKQNRLWFCPVAQKPTTDEYGVYTPNSTVFSAWGIYYSPGLLSAAGIAGSYGLNGYVLAISGGNFERGISDRAG